ncbi:MAG: protein translocase subunit SecD, partial [Thermoleophilaceae bacterium]
MTSRNRNLGILALVAFLLVLAGLLIVPGTPLSKKTRLGLDLRGGTELVYEGRPTPKVPKVTSQSINDAIDTIRKRADALGVSEPEIQQSGKNQISVSLPDVKNAQRAKEQVGTTAQLQFYDWEPNVLGNRGPDAPYTGSTSLFQAAVVASKSKPRAEPTDIPSGGPSKDVVRRFHGDQKKIQQYYDRRNDTSTTKYYLFGPDHRPLGDNGRPLKPGTTYQPSGSCKELLSNFTPRPGKARTYPRNTACSDELKALEGGGPPSGSTVVKVPQGIVIVQAEHQKNQPPTLQQFFVIEDDSELSGSDIKNPKAQNDQQTGGPVVTMEFTDSGRKAFARATKREAERGSRVILPPGTSKEQAFQRFAITLDNKIVSLATIDFVQNPEGIDGRTGAQIENIGTLQDASDLAQNLRIGALPIELKLISQTQVSASLGKQALHQGLLAGAVGLVLTILFLLLFYRVLGGVATVALLIYAFLLFALIKLIPITLTLPGIAGMVLTLAVAADANIVMYERIKEEVRSGRSIPAAISSGYTKALKAIIDANVVTVGVAFILFTLATAGVKGFAFTLGVGTLVSLFTAVLATSAILGSLARSRLLSHRSALGVSAKERSGWRFDFMGRSKYFFSLSGAIIAIGAVAIAGLGINFGIDFESGTRITAPLERAASVEQVRNAISPLGYGDAKILQVNDKALGKHVVQISTKTLQPARVNKVESALNQKFGIKTGNFSADSIGPTFGAQIARTAVIAIIASLFLISIYIAMRFEIKFAVPVLIALAHDLLITSGVYALTEREVTTSTVAALLTIMGFSLYDTVIVFDRIRENVPRMPRATFSQIANRSMAEVLTRSLATTFVVLLPVGSLMLFGGQTLKDFAFALLVGVLSGAYSSIFIATPVLNEWKERENVYMRRRRVVLEEHGGMVPAFATAAEATAAPAAPVATSEGRPPRSTRRERRERAARTGRTAVKPPPPAPPPPPATDGPPPEPKPRQPSGDGGDGDGARAAEPQRRVTSTAGSGAPKPKADKPKPKRSRGRKKHGRS